MLQPTTDIVPFTSLLRWLVIGALSTAAAWTLTLAQADLQEQAQATAVESRT